MLPSFYNVACEHHSAPPVIDLRYILYSNNPANVSHVMNIIEAHVYLSNAW